MTAWKSPPLGSKLFVMVRTEMLPKPEKKNGEARHAGALAASCLFHAAFLGLLLWVTLTYRAKWMLPPSGSQANEPTMTLSTLVITRPPPTIISSPPKPTQPVATTTPTPVVTETPPLKPATPPQPVPVEAVPVLAVQPSKPAAALQPKTEPTQPKHTAAASVAKASPVKPKPEASASFASSYAPGENVLPHPPYPEEAQDLGETGTVVMTVTFGTAGNVTQAEVSQSSGVRVLDTTTRSFILTHWHSTMFAGQTVMQPVRYTGE
jgi:TonB family protein